MIDISKLEGTLQQVSALANFGGIIVQAGAAVVEQVVEILKSKGYDVDTAHLDVLIADADRRRQLAEQEAQR